MSYARANGDYDLDGELDDDDSLVEQDYLGIWVRDGAGNPWFPVRAEHSVAGRWFLGYLEHFSNYAVAW